MWEEQKEIESIRKEQKWTKRGRFPSVQWSQDWTWNSDDSDVVHSDRGDALDAAVLLHAVEQWLAEPDQVHGHGDRVGQEEHETNGAPEFRTWKIKFLR